MTTLLYLASGGYKPAYEDLPYEQIICVDRSQSYRASYPKQNTKVIFLPMDALFAVGWLKSRSITIDCLVSINEGLYGGNGSYVIFTGFLMGYLSPHLKEDICVICNLSYYDFSNRAAVARLDWGFQKVIHIKEGMTGYIDPQLFTDNIQNKPFGHVFQMKKIKKSMVIKSFKIKTTLIHGSIWEDEHMLDFIGISLRSLHTIPRTPNNPYSNPAEYFKSKPKVVDLKGKSFSDIMELAKEKGAKHIGLCPWNLGDYDDVITYLRAKDLSCFESISFYHLNQKDYKSLYALNIVENGYI